MFAWLHSSNVLAQAHVTPDSRYIVLPVIVGSRITGWKVYATDTGLIVKPRRDDPDPEAPRDGLWPRLHQARNWVTARFYPEENAS